MKKRGRRFQFNLNMSNRLYYTLILIGVLIVGGWVVFAYTGNVGHTSDQIDEIDPTVSASVKDGVNWNELSGIPAGFADNVDDVGSVPAQQAVACSDYQCQVHCWVHGSPGWRDDSSAYIGGQNICLLYPDPFVVGSTYTMQISSQSGAYRCTCN